MLSFMPLISPPPKRTKQGLSAKDDTDENSPAMCKFIFEFSDAYFANDVLWRIYVCPEDVGYLGDWDRYTVEG